MTNLLKHRYFTLIFSKIFLASSVGNVLEFYDFATYGFLMPVMAHLFFPAENSFSSLLMSCGAFAISFLARPAGGLLFGYIGDFYGRKIAFSSSLILMAIATTAIGALPTYQEIGLLAPIALILCRLVQGLCLGGEFSGSLIFATEHFRHKKYGACFITGTITSAGVGGWFLSSLICTVSTKLPHPYSWRVPFLLGSIVGVLGYYIRRAISEPPIKLQPASKSLQKVIKLERVTALSIVGIGILMGGIFYGIHIFPNGFLPTHFPSISHVQALMYTSIGIGVYMLSLPFMGILADCTSPTKCMKFFAFLTILLAYPIIHFLISGEAFSIIISETLASVILAGFMAPATAVMSQSFLPSFRHRMVSFNYNVGASLVGGFTPMIFLLLTENLKLLYGPSLYIAFCGIIGCLSSYYLGKKSNSIKV